jgi:hypothetical protein
VQKLYSLRKVINCNNAGIIVSALKSIVPTYMPAPQKHDYILDEVAVTGGK